MIEEEQIPDPKLGITEESAKQLSDTIQELNKQLAKARKERDDWRWGYQMTEGILKADPKWHGVDERFSDKSPILAVKLAKEAMGRKRPTHAVATQVVIPDYYRDLVDWMAGGSYRSVCRKGNVWIIRDEAMGRHIDTLDIGELLKSEVWIRFKKGL